MLPGRGPDGRCIPELPPELNGLLPGRGPAGRGAGRALAAGFAAGEAEAAGASAGGCAAGAGAGAGAAAGLGAGAGVGAWAVAGVGAGVGLGAAFFAGAFLAAGAGAEPASGKASRNLRATGGSIVDDADLTNSPISCNFANAVLESIPSSLATSYTRALATSLRPGPRLSTQTYKNCCELIAGDSSSTHSTAPECSVDITDEILRV